MNKEETLLVKGTIKEPALEGDVGYDLVVSKRICVRAHRFTRVPMDVSIAIPPGFWGLLIARSGTNLGGQLLVLPGVIDEGYRGPLFALVHNLSVDSITLEPGQRICQLILIKSNVFPITFVDQLPPSARGVNGFGSTGE